MTNQELKNIIVEELNSLEDYLYESQSTSIGEEAIETTANMIIKRLPEQIITKDKIVEVLERTVATMKYKSLSIEESIKKGAFISARYTKEQIASEILQGQEWKVVAGGKVYIDLTDYEEYGEIGKKELYLVFKPYHRKNIEIAAREVK